MHPVFLIYLRIPHERQCLLMHASSRCEQNFGVKDYCAGMAAAAQGLSAILEWSEPGLRSMAPLCASHPPLPPSTSSFPCVPLSLHLGSRDFYSQVLAGLGSCGHLNNKRVLIAARNLRISSCSAAKNLIFVLQDGGQNKTVCWVLVFVYLVVMCVPNRKRP